MADDIFLSYYSTSLYNEDVATVLQQDGTSVRISDDPWLTDNVITFWLEYVSHTMLDSVKVALVHPSTAYMCMASSFRISDALLERACTAAAASSLHEMFDTTATLTDEEDEMNDLYRCLRGLELSTRECVLMPVNNSTSFAQAAAGSHWSLLIFYLGHFYHADSVTGSTNLIAAQRIARVLCPLLRVPTTTAKKIEPLVCPQQQNVYDCGVFTLAFAERIAIAAAHGVAPAAALTDDTHALGAVMWWEPLEYRKRIYSTMKDLQRKATER